LATYNRLKIPQNLGFLPFSISSCWVKFGCWNLGNSYWVFNWTESQLKFTSWTLQFHLFLSFLLPSKSLIFQLKIWLFQSTYCFGVLGRFGLWDFTIGVRFHLLELRIHLFIRSLFLAAHLIEFGDLISDLISLILFFVLIFRSVRLELS